MNKINAGQRSGLMVSRRKLLQSAAGLAVSLAVRALVVEPGRGGNFSNPRVPAPSHRRDPLAARPADRLDDEEGPAQIDAGRARAIDGREHGAADAAAEAEADAATGAERADLACWNDAARQVQVKIDPAIG